MSGVDLLDSAPATVVHDADSPAAGPGTPAPCAKEPTAAERQRRYRERKRNEESAENTAQKQRRGRPFAKGESGNPKGRPAGTRNRATIIAQALLDGQAEALAAKAVEMALSGDGAALRLCLERLVPPRREAPVSVVLPDLAKAADAAAAMAAIVKAAGAGDILLGEATALAALVDVYRKAVETAELERRIAALEEGLVSHERT